MKVRCWCSRWADVGPFVGHGVQGDADSDVYFVIAGSVGLSVQDTASARSCTLYQVESGQMFGELSVLSDTGSFFEARVSSDRAVVFVLPRLQCIRCVWQSVCAL